MTTHAPKTPMEYTRDITSLFNSYCRDIDIESITEPRKKKQVWSIYVRREHQDILYSAVASCYREYLNSQSTHLRKAFHDLHH